MPEHREKCSNRCSGGGSRLRARDVAPLGPGPMARPAVGLIEVPPGLLGSGASGFAAKEERHLGRLSWPAPVWWIDSIEQPRRQRSDAWPCRLQCGSPHLPAAARYPAAAPISWPPLTPP